MNEVGLAFILSFAGTCLSVVVVAKFLIWRSECRMKKLNSSDMIHRGIHMDKDSMWKEPKG